MQCECVSAKWIKRDVRNYILEGFFFLYLEMQALLIGSHFPSMKCFFFHLPFFSFSLSRSLTREAYPQLKIILGKTPAVLDFGNALYLIHKMLLSAPLLCVMAHLVMKKFDGNFRISIE